MNYEEAILEIEGNERYNVVILLTFSVMACIQAMDINSIVFLGYTPSFECIDKSFNGTNATWIENQCYGDIKTINGTYERVHCTKWKFDKSVMTNTIATEFNLVCNKKSYVTIMNTLYFVGMAIGKFIGISGDRIGRIRLIQMGVIWEICINILLPFMPNIWLIFLLRFLIGFGTSKIYQAICYITEIVSTERRSIYTNNFWILFVFGYMLIPGIVFGTRDWRMSRYFMNIPMLFYIFYFWVPESPRWLGIVGRDKKAQENLLCIAKRNGKHLQSNKFDALIVRKKEQARCNTLLGTKTMRIKIFVLIFAYGGSSLTYSGLSIDESFISNNIFLNVFIQGSIELFIGPLAWISSTKLNRKLSLLIYFSITAICLLVNTVISSKTMFVLIIKTMFCFIGKFTLAIAYALLDTYLNEVFPTVIRNLAVFMILGISSVFVVLVPTINELNKYVSMFSFMCYAVMCAISGVIIYYLLPETKGCPLPQTMKEGDELRKGNEKNYCDMVLLNTKNSIVMTD